MSPTFLENADKPGAAEADSLLGVLPREADDVSLQPNVIEADQTLENASLLNPVLMQCAFRSTRRAGCASPGGVLSSFNDHDARHAPAAPSAVIPAPPVNVGTAAHLFIDCFHSFIGPSTF